jgi:hypothetical protein
MPQVADPNVPFWCLLVLQIVGLASMFLARMSRPTLLHNCCRLLFVVCLVVVGLATIYAMGLQSSTWAWCGTTFSVMAVGGTMDLGCASRIVGF